MLRRPLTNRFFRASRRALQIAEVFLQERFALADLCKQFGISMEVKLRTAVAALKLSEEGGVYGGRSSGSGGSGKKKTYCRKHGIRGHRA